MRAYDKETGEEVGAVWMPAQVSGSPMTYRVGGRQYIVIAVSGGNYSGEYIAFALPASDVTTPAGRSSDGAAGPQTRRAFSSGIAGLVRDPDSLPCDEPSPFACLPSALRAIGRRLRVWDGVFTEEQVKRGQRRTCETAQTVTERRSKAAT